MPARTRSILLVALLAAALAAGAGAEDDADAAKRRDIEELLRVLGQWDEGSRMISELLQSTRLAYPNVPQAEWAKLAAATGLADLNEKYAALYDRLYSAEEIQEILAFHRTPAGRKWHAGSQQLEDHLRIARGDFEGRLGERVARVLHAHGYEDAGVPRREPLVTPAAPVYGRPRIVQPIE